MKKISILILLTVLFTAEFFSENLYAASSTHLPGLFTSPRNETLVMGNLEVEYQEQIFPRQNERSVEINNIGDAKIFIKSRSSRDSFTYAGVKAGIKPGVLPFFYLTAGYARGKIDFSFEDANTDNKNTYSLETTFDTDVFPVFGVGITAQPLRKSLDEKHTLHLGLDLNYQYMNFEADETAGSRETEFYDMTYESTLHGVQLTVVGAVDGFSLEPVKGMTLSLVPYLGCKVAHFFAEESFTDTGNVASNFKHDPIIYDGDLQDSNHISFLAGAGIEITDNVVITLEARTGDEDGYAGNVLFRF